MVSNPNPVENKNKKKVTMKRRQTTLDQIGNFMNLKDNIPGLSAQGEKEISSDSVKSTEFDNKFISLDQSQKKERVKHLWAIFYNKLRGANVVLQKYYAIK